MAKSVSLELQLLGFFWKQRQANRQTHSLGYGDTNNELPCLSPQISLTGGRFFPKSSSHSVTCI